MKGKKVLIIDDDVNVASALTKPLEAAGAQVHSANTYADGMLAITRDHPDAVILDVMLKDGKSGLEIAKEIHAMPLPHPFVMILTNAINPDSIAEAMATDVTLFVQKAENDPEDVVKLLAKHISE